MLWPSFMIHLSVLVFVHICMSIWLFCHIPTFTLSHWRRHKAQEAETNPLWAKKSGRAGQIPQKKSASSSCFLFFFTNFYSKVHVLSILMISPAIRARVQSRHVLCLLTSTYQLYDEDDKDHVDDDVDGNDVDDDDDCNSWGWWWWQWVNSPASETSSRFSGTTAFPGPTSLLTCKLIIMRMITGDVEKSLRGSVFYWIHLSTLCAGGSLATEFARISSVEKVKIGAEPASQHWSYFINGANIFPGMISRCSNIINITFMSLKLGKSWLAIES